MASINTDRVRSVLIGVTWLQVEPGSLEFDPLLEVGNAAGGHHATLSGRDIGLSGDGWFSFVTPAPDAQYRKITGPLASIVAVSEEVSHGGA